jgi:predicted Rossmann fold nucleotide-binding protein DprA/Smf involved in DNA uptake
MPRSPDVIENARRDHADAEDFLEELRAFLGLRPLPKEPRACQAQVLDALGDASVKLHELARRVRARNDQVSHVLRRLEARGKVVRLGAGFWRRTHVSAVAAE